jgi:hypothetical protein
MKSISALHLENSIKSLQNIKIQDKIQDTPRTVTEFQFCRSQPKVRNNPQLYGLSRRALELIGVDYEATTKDPAAGEFLSGSKLLAGSEVPFP